MRDTFFSLGSRKKSCVSKQVVKHQFLCLYRNINTLNISCSTVIICYYSSKYFIKFLIGCINLCNICRKTLHVQTLNTNFLFLLKRFIYLLWRLKYGIPSSVGFELETAYCALHPTQMLFSGELNTPKQEGVTEHFPAHCDKLKSLVALKRMSSSGQFNPPMIEYLIILTLTKAVSTCKKQKMNEN